MDLQFRSSEEDVIYYKEWRAEIMLEFSLTVWNILLLLLYVSWCIPSILSWAAPHLSTRCQTPDLPIFNLHSFSSVKVLFIHRKVIQISHNTKTAGLGTEGSQVDYFKRNYLLLSVFPDKKEDLAVLAFGSLLPFGHLFSFLVLHLLPLVEPPKESSCGRTCGYVRLRLPINALPSPPCSNT